MDERLEDFREIVAYARSKGYVNYDEINEMLPPEFSSTEDMDFLFQLLDDEGIDISEKRVVEEIPVLAKPHAPESLLEYDPDLERTNDPVKMYLREMGQTPLLNREGEVRIAKAIERGRKVMIKALSRSRYAAQMILDIGDEIKEDPESAKQYFAFYDDLDDDEALAQRLEEQIEIIDRIAAIQKEVQYLSKRILRSQEPQGQEGPGAPLGAEPDLRRAHPEDPRAGAQHPLHQRDDELLQAVQPGDPRPGRPPTSASRPATRRSSASPRGSSSPSAWPR